MGRTATIVLVIVGIAAVIAFVPGGQTGGETVVGLLSAAMTATIVLFSIYGYRQMRGRLDLLENSSRALLYGGVAVIVLALAANSQLRGVTGGFAVVLALVLAGGAMLYAFWQRWRDV